MLELEGHPEDRTFDDELLPIAQDLPGQQVLVLLENGNLDHVLANLRQEPEENGKRVPGASRRKSCSATTSVMAASTSQI